MSRISSKWLLNLSALGVVIVGGLQMYRVKAGWITSYGGDLIGPVFLYVATRSGKTVLKWFPISTPGPVAAAVWLFGLCALWELCQLRDWSGTPLAITRGRFDPVDLAVYASALLGCALADLKWGERIFTPSPQTP